MNPLTISSGLMTPNWISLICRIGADEYGNEIVILANCFVYPSIYNPQDREIVVSCRLCPRWSSYQIACVSTKWSETGGESCVSLPGSILTDPPSNRKPRELVCSCRALRSDLCPSHDSDYCDCRGADCALHLKTNEADQRVFGVFVFLKQPDLFDSDQLSKCGTDGDLERMTSGTW